MYTVYIIYIIYIYTYIYTHIHTRPIYTVYYTVVGLVCTYVWGIWWMVSWMTNVYFVHWHMYLVCIPELNDPYHSLVNKRSPIYMYIYIYIYSTDQMQGMLVYFTRICTRRQTNLYTEANTCLYIVKWVYTRRQTPLHDKAKAFALYLASDMYCTYTLCNFLKWFRAMVM